MAEWVRGLWHYSLTTDGLIAEIQVEHLGDKRIDPDIIPYPNDHFPWTVLRKEYAPKDHMTLELLQVTGFTKSTLKKRGFKEYRIYYGQEDWELVD